MSGVAHGVQGMCMLSAVQLFETPVDCSPAGSSGHARQEDWSGLPFPPSADLPSAGTELTSPVSPALSSGFFTPEPPVLFNRLSLDIYYIDIVVCICGEGNGKPLQYSCLENPMDGGAWWAAFHGVATSRS